MTNSVTGRIAIRSSCTKCQTASTSAIEIKVPDWRENISSPSSPFESDRPGLLFLQAWIIAGNACCLNFALDPTPKNFVGFSTNLLSLRSPTNRKRGDATSVHTDHRSKTRRPGWWRARLSPMLADTDNSRNILAKTHARVECSCTRADFVIKREFINQKGGRSGNDSLRLLPTGEA